MLHSSPSQKKKQLEHKYHASADFPNEKYTVVLADRDYFKRHSQNAVTILQFVVKIICYYTFTRAYWPHSYCWGLYFSLIVFNGGTFRCRNIFAIQQNLTNITMTREGDLDRARQYYELLYSNPDVSALLFPLP